MDLLDPPAELLHEMPDQQRNVFRPLAQRRHADGKHVEPVVQVGAEFLLVHQRLQVAIGRRDQARIGAQRARRSQPLELALLQHAQQLRLQFQRHFADLVQEHGAVMRQLEAADALRNRARKRAALVPEQFALQQPGRNRRAVQLHETVRLAASSDYAPRAQSAPCPCPFRRRSAPSNRWAPPSPPAAARGAAPRSCRRSLRTSARCGSRLRGTAFPERSLFFRSETSPNATRVFHRDGHLARDLREKREIVRRKRVFPPPAQARARRRCRSAPSAARAPATESPARQELASRSISSFVRMTASPLRNTRSATRLLLGRRLEPSSICPGLPGKSSA